MTIGALGLLLAACSGDANRAVASGLLSGNATYCQSGSKYGTQCRTQFDEPGDTRRRNE